VTGDETVRLDTTPQAEVTPPLAGALTYEPRTYRPSRKLSLVFDARAVGVVGGYVVREHGMDVFGWSPIPGVAVRWHGELRTPGLVLGLSAVLSVLADLPQPWSVVVAGWLAVPAGAAFWHAWLRGRLI
jgi:hypothetical protein